MLCIAVVYVAAILFFLRRIHAKLRHDPRPLRLGEKLAYAVSVLGLLCFLYGWKVEPYWPQVTHATVATSKFQHGTASVRIALISDLHMDEQAYADAKVATLVRAERPDMICFAGDALNTRDASRFQVLMRELAQIAPVFAVRGNWDHALDEHALYDGLPVTLLRDRALDLEIKGQKLLLGGSHAEEITAIEKRFPKDDPRFKIFLYHYPDAIEEAKAEGIDLYLAGHTHGGQVRLPFYGALVTFSRYDKKYEAGFYPEGGTYMYVNRGIGMEGGRAPRVRFLDRPEITVIDIASR